MNIYEKYKKAGLIPFSFTIDQDKNGNKKLLNMPSHININKYDKTYIDKRKNGLGIRTGTKTKKIICLSLVLMWIIKKIKKGF
jgi:hypothetical protein